MPFAMGIRKVLRLEMTSDGSDREVNKCTAISVNLVAEVPVGDVCRSTPALSAVKQHHQMEVRRSAAISTHSADIVAA